MGDNEGDAQDFTTCMFCGVNDPTWNEDALDLHYWKDCASLAPCPACAQVVEVAGMADHLLEECEHKAEYVQHTASGLAVRKDELADWADFPACAAGKMYCPLCQASVADTDDAWRAHLFDECTKNTRAHAAAAHK